MGKKAEEPSNYIRHGVGWMYPQEGGTPIPVFTCIYMPMPHCIQSQAYIVCYRCTMVLLTQGSIQSIGQHGHCHSYRHSHNQARGKLLHRVGYGASYVYNLVWLCVYMLFYAYFISWNAWAGLYRLLCKLVYGINLTLKISYVRLL